LPLAWQRQYLGPLQLSPLRQQHRLPLQFVHPFNGHDVPSIDKLGLHLYLVMPQAVQDKLPLEQELLLDSV
jgi:hypothetical protein